MLLGQHLRFPGIDVIFMDFCKVKISPKAGRQAAFPQNCGLLLVKVNVWFLRLVSAIIKPMHGSLLVSSADVMLNESSSVMWC